jgi:pimeloyl-ACP methyl ester carboxylesterase
MCTQTGCATRRQVGTGALPPLWDRLSELTMPVRLLVGERDDKFQRLALAMAERLDNAQVIVVAGAGHAVHLEDPAQVAAALSS